MIRQLLAIRIARYCQAAQSRVWMRPCPQCGITLEKREPQVPWMCSECGWR